MDKLENLKLGRQQRYVGDQAKIKTTLSLSKSARDFLQQSGNSMSETIEFLVWVHSKGKSGIVTPRFEMLRDRIDKGC